MTDYKKYALGQVENFLYDAMGTDATPQEIYDVIKGVVQDNLNVYTKSADQARELLNLLNGNRKGHLSCDKDDPSPECKGAWNDFWEEHYYPEEHQQYTEEELNAMCDAAEKAEKVKKWILPVEVDGPSAEYFVTFPDDLLEAADLKEGDQVKWIDQGDGSYLLKKVKQPSWVEGNELAKVKTYAEMIEDGWEMTDDGFWIKETKSLKMDEC